MITKIASILSTEVVEALAREAETASHAAGSLGSHGVGSALSRLAPETGGKPFRFSLKLPQDSGRLARVMHYGVQPVILGKNIADVADAAGELKKISPDKLVSLGVDPDEAHRIYRKARGGLIGRTIGDAASWATYPLSVANPLVHYPLVTGTAIGAPSLGEYLGQRLSAS